MRQEAVTVIRLDASGLPAQSAVVDRAFSQMAAKGEASVGQIRAAMRSLPAQFTDVATQLAGGQNPLLVLLQQGGQVRDQFGSIGAALRGIGSFLTPGVLGVAGVAALAGVLAAAEKDAGRLRDTLALTNNAAGLTGGRLDEIAQRISDSSRQTAGGARDIVLALAEQGTVSGRVLESMAVAVARVADVTGRSADDVAKDFAGMTRDVASWAVEHNRQFNFITADQYLYIKRLQDMGREEQAAIEVNKLLVGQLESQRKNLGLLERGWDAVKNAASSAWQAMLGVGRQTTLQEQLAEINDRVRIAEQNLAGASIRNGGKRKGTALSELQELREEQLRIIRQIEREQDNADARSAKAAAERAKIDKLREKPKAGKSELGNYNELGLFVGPQYVSPMEAFRRSELGATAAVNKELSDRQLRESVKRSAAQDELLRQLVDANAQANLQLIADDQQRALAQVDIERSVMQRRIETIYASGPERAAAEALADATALAQRQAVAAKFARDASLVTHENVRDALVAAFRDTKNPIKAFANALGEVVYQRLASRIADALVTGMMGNGAGGALGGIIGAGLGWLTGDSSIGNAGYGDYRAWGSSGVKLATGTNYVPYDGMRAILHEGEAVVPKRYNPAAGGGAAAQVNLQVINQTGQPVNASARQRGGGDIEVLLTAVNQAMAGRIASGQGEISQALQARFGLRPTVG